MLNLDALMACVEAFLVRRECKRWRFGARYNSGASTRVVVEAVTLTWDDALPEARQVGLREAWTLCGGMEHGNHDVHAQISVGTKTTRTVRTEADVAAFLDEQLPTGAAP